MIIARRYARALQEEAERESKLDAVDRDVEMIAGTFEGSLELVGFFRIPIISREKKEAVVDRLFGGRIDPTTLQFLNLLIRKQREALVPDIVRAYRSLRDEERGILEAEARVAETLSAGEEKKLIDALSNMTGKKIRLNVTIDREMLGGVVVRVGDTVYDGSVRHQLDLLRERMN